MILATSFPCVPLLRKQLCLNQGELGLGGGEAGERGGPWILLWHHHFYRALRSRVGAIGTKCMDISSSSTKAANQG